MPKHCKRTVRRLRRKGGSRTRGRRASPTPEQMSSVNCNDVRHELETLRVNIRKALEFQEELETILSTQCREY